MNPRSHVRRRMDHGVAFRFEVYRNWGGAHSRSFGMFGTRPVVCGQVTRNWPASKTGVPTKKRFARSAKRIHHSRGDRPPRVRKWQKLPRRYSRRQFRWTFGALLTETLSKLLPNGIANAVPMRSPFVKRERRSSDLRNDHGKIGASQGELGLGVRSHSQKPGGGSSLQKSETTFRVLLARRHPNDLSLQFAWSISQKTIWHSNFANSLMIWFSDGVVRWKAIANQKRLPFELKPFLTN